MLTNAPPVRTPNAIEPVTLAGIYVRLEPLSREHVAPLLRAATGDRSSFAFTLVPPTEDAMREYVDQALAAQAQGHALPFAVIERVSETVRGSTRFGNIEFWPWPRGHRGSDGDHRPDAVEIGWTWYAAPAQRTGLNTEAKLLMLTHAFEVWHVHRVRLLTDARNVLSRAAIVRLGAFEDGVLRADRLGADGTVRSSAVFSILAGEWPGVKQRLRGLLR